MRDGRLLPDDVDTAFQWVGRNGAGIRIAQSIDGYVWQAPAEEAYYSVAIRPASRRSLVGWGGVNKKPMNQFVTCDALSVLAATRKV